MRRRPFGREKRAVCRCKTASAATHGCPEAATWPLRPWGGTPKMGPLPARRRRPHHLLMYSICLTVTLSESITNDYILYGNIGDSSGYVMKNGLLHKITKDHTLVNLLVSTGELTPEQAKFHPRKNLLTRALGANDPIEIDIFDVDTNVSGLFLCSDGLTNMVADDQIEKVLNNKSSIEEQVEKLIKKSNMRGGTDNISIAYMQIESGDF